MCGSKEKLIPYRKTLLTVLQEISINLTKVCRMRGRHIGPYITELRKTYTKEDSNTTCMK